MNGERQQKLSMKVKQDKQTSGLGPETIRLVYCNASVINLSCLAQWNQWADPKKCNHAHMTLQSDLKKKRFNRILNGMSTQDCFI